MAGYSDTCKNLARHLAILSRRYRLIANKCAVLARHEDARYAGGDQPEDILADVTVQMGTVANLIDACRAHTGELYETDGGGNPLIVFELYS